MTKGWQTEGAADQYMKLVDVVVKYQNMAVVAAANR